MGINAPMSSAAANAASPPAAGAVSWAGMEPASAPPLDRARAPAGAELARALEAGHADAWGWALSCCARRHGDAADALQTAYLEVLRGRAVFRGPLGDAEALRRWWYGVIRHCAHRQARSFARWFRRSSEAPLFDDPASPPDPRAEALGRALPHLPARQREVLHLVFYEGLTVDAAAGRLGVSAGTARQHYERGKARLRQLLAPSTQP